MTDSPNSRPTIVRYYVLAALCVVTVINYMQRNSIGGVETTLRQDLQIDQTVTGTAMSLFFISYALMQIPSGWLAQRWGPRRALTAYTVGWSLATATLALAQGAYWLYGSRLAMGILQAGIFPCATLIMAAWLPPTQRGLASALLNSFMLIGGAVVSNLTAVLLAPRAQDGLYLLDASGSDYWHFGWRELFVIYALPGFLWATWFYFWFRDRPADHRAVNAAELVVIGAGKPPATETHGAVRVAWLAVLLSLPLWLICAQQFCRAGANRFTDQWLSTYLQEGPLRHIADAGARKKLANNLTSAPQYAGVIGGVIGGGLSDYVLRRTGRRRLARNGVAAMSLLVTVLCYLPIFAFDEAGMQVVFFSLGSLIGSFAAPCAYALSMDVSGKNLPVVFGAMNMVGNFGAAAMTKVVPYLVMRSDAGDEPSGAAPADWRLAIAVFIGVHFVALICWLLLDPNRRIGEVQETSS